MSAQIVLIAPAELNAGDLTRKLGEAMSAASIAAVVVPRGARSEGNYKVLAKAVIGLAQPAGIAVLIEGEPGLVRTLGADGLHVDGSVADVRAATAALKPAFIVGAGGVQSRHDAMSKGEFAPDYMFFGPLAGPRDPEQREMARWWSEIMEVPGVMSDPLATVESATSEGCDFMALGESLWTASEGIAARITAIAQVLEAEQ